MEVNKRGRKALGILDIMSAEDFAEIKSIVDNESSMYRIADYLGDYLMGWFSIVIRKRYPNIKGVRRCACNIVKKEFAYLDYNPFKRWEFLSRHYSCKLVNIGGKIVSCPIIPKSERT